jgi:hypothetical protein
MSDKSECGFPRFDDLVSNNDAPFWDVRMSLKERMEQIHNIRDELKEEYEAALESEDFGDIDTGVLWGAFSLVDSLVLGTPTSCRTCLQALQWGHPLWDISRPEADRLKQMIKARDKIEEEWREHLDDDSASHLDTGMLLGAMNLIDDLLQGVVETMTQSEFEKLGRDAIPGYGTNAQWKYGEAREKLANGLLRIVPDETE